MQPRIYEVDTKCMLCMEPYITDDPSGKKRPFQICSSGYFMWGGRIERSIGDANGGMGATNDANEIRTVIEFDKDDKNYMKVTALKSPYCYMSFNTSTHSIDFSCPFRCANMQIKKGHRFYSSRDRDAHILRCMNPDSNCGKEISAFSRASDSCEQTHTELIRLFKNMTDKMGNIGKAHEEIGASIGDRKGEVCELVETRDKLHGEIDDAKQRLITLDDNRETVLADMRRQAKHSVVARRWKELDDAKQAIEDEKVKLNDVMVQLEETFINKSQELNEQFKLDQKNLQEKSERKRSEHDASMNDLAASYDVKKQKLGDQICEMENKLVYRKQKMETEISDLKYEHELEMDHMHKIHQNKNREFLIWKAEQLKQLDIETVFNRLSDRKDRDKVLDILTKKFQGEISIKMKKIEVEEKAKTDIYIEQYKQSKKAHAKNAHDMMMHDIKKTRKNAVDKVNADLQKFGASVEDFKTWFKTQDSDNQ